MRLVRSNHSEMSEMFGKRYQECDNGVVTLHSNLSQYLKDIGVQTEDVVSAMREKDNVLHDKEKYIVLKRANRNDTSIKIDKIEKKDNYRSYGDRLENYNKVRNRIFGTELSMNKLEKIKETRKKFKDKKSNYNNVKNSVRNVCALYGEMEKDPRAFIEFNIGKTKIKGLLDTGASISLLGNNCEAQYRYPNRHCATSSTTPTAIPPPTLVNQGQTP